MKSYSSRELIKMAEQRGWQLRRVNGSHHIFSHPGRNYVLAIPHPKKDFPPKTLASILRQIG